MGTSAVGAMNAVCARCLLLLKTIAAYIAVRREVEGG